MGEARPRGRLLGFGVSVFLAAWLASGAQPARADSELQSEMRQIFGALQVLLPAAVAGRFGDPEHADEIQSAFRSLETHAELLDTHGNGLDAGARLFGQALAQDARQALAFYQRGQTDSAAFYVESLVDDCVACHTRYPSIDSPWAEGFLDQRDFNALDPLERATVQVATRRFDEALATYERVLQSPRERVGLLLGPLSTYLSVALRVKRDPVRPLPLLRELADRDDVPSVIREDVVFWRDQLAETTSADLRGDTLARARRAMKRADDAARFPGDPHALIAYLVASAQLYELLNHPQDSPRDASEIYFLLGKAELGIGHSAWLPRSDLFLETAIRLAPGTEPARDAFALLQSEIHAGYTGSAGLRLPPEQSRRLAELRALNEGAALDDPTQLERAQAGERLFEHHCAMCHGATARGDGPLATTLMTRPKDLTRISARRGGEFPAAEVRSLIDGRDPLGGHRSPEMPRWGEFWTGPEKLDALVAFLRGIQR